MDGGMDIVRGDLVLAGGVIREVGKVEFRELGGLGNVTVVDAQGAWLTPGIIDMHSHIGTYPVPLLSGALDANSRTGGVVTPWMRAIDALNTHDDSYKLSVAGGVTASLVLPGSSNAIGGQAAVVKLRPTSEKTPDSLVLESPYNADGLLERERPRWRHMKHALGENPSGTLPQGTRMDTIWKLREAYSTAKKIKVQQDEFCSSVQNGKLSLRPFPGDPNWEALVDVLRGRGKIHVHVYEAVDLSALAELSNEFQLPIAAVHHAHEAYLVPGLLNRTYGPPPAVAMFAAFGRYKREAYRHSEFAPRILADQGFTVIMKSDHAVINSRYVLHEAQQAHHYGLRAELALASVTTSPARVLELDHRIGYIKPGYDADLVLWDSHPLSLGATPSQIFIDGIPQIDTLDFKQPRLKSVSLQKAPTTPAYDVEAANAVTYDGLPPLEPEYHPSVLFTNVSEVTTRSHDGTSFTSNFRSDRTTTTVLVVQGRVECIGTRCQNLTGSEDVPVIDLEGGALSPALTTFGSQIGLEDITVEPSTGDGFLSRLSAEGVRAVDALRFGGRDALISYRSGISVGIVAPRSLGVFTGFGTAFSLGALHKLEWGAVVKDVTAFHVAVDYGHLQLGSSGSSVSTEITALRRLFLGGSRVEWVDHVLQGKFPLVVHTNSADVMATILALKREIEEATSSTIRMTFVGGAEAHLLAREIAEAGVGVVVIPPRSFPYTWSGRRILPGPPLTELSLVSALHTAGVKVAIGPETIGGFVSGSLVRNLRFDAAWVASESAGIITEEEAIAMASLYVEQLFGVHIDPKEASIVAVRGGKLLSFEGKVVGMVSPLKKGVAIF